MEPTAYKQGTPCWVDLATTDLDGAKAFYSTLFGWEFNDIAPEAGGPYTMIELDGEPVAGLARGPEGFPPAWSTYLAVDDCDAATEAAVAAGASVMMPVMEAMGMGKMSFVFDPQGAHVGFWQALAHRGSEVVNQPGGFAWSELHSPDPEASAAFYGAVVGVGTSTRPYGDDTYTMLLVDDRPVGGLMSGADAAARWHTYFGVDDCRAVAESVKGLGGRVLVEPFETPGGPSMATFADPQGAVFSVVEVTESQ